MFDKLNVKWLPRSDEVRRPLIGNNKLTVHAQQEDHAICAYV